MTTESWFRNPNAYIRELVEVGQFKIAWDRGYLIKRRIDPIKHAELYYGLTYPWRVLAVGGQGSAEYRAGDEWDKPTAVYPTWVYGVDDHETLVDMLENPAGEDEDACTDKGVDGNERPVFGQEHRVIITEMPPGSTGPGKAFMRWLKELQEDHQNCIIHLHGVYSWRVAFGHGWGAADVDPRVAAQKGKVHLPSGKEERYEQVQAHPHWVTALGFAPAELAVPRNRCMYNIRSAVWAGENYQTIFNFRTRNDTRPDTSTPRALYSPPVTKSPIVGASVALPGDKIACDSCSLADKCKVYRAGAVCTLDGTESKELAQQFRTRDSSQIIDVLGTLTAAGMRRLEDGMRQEEVLDELDPHVTKMLNQTFNQGVVLAKLVDPALRGGAKVQVNVGGPTTVTVSSPNAMIAQVMREFEKQGYTRDQITPEMVNNMLSNMAQNQAAIEGQVVEESA